MQDIKDRVEAPKIATLEEINLAIEKFLDIEKDDPEYACFMANGIFSTLLADYVEPLQKQVKELTEREAKLVEALKVLTDSDKIRRAEIILEHYKLGK